MGTLDDIVSLLDDGDTGAVSEEEFTEGFAILAAATSLDQLRKNIQRFQIEKTLGYNSRRESIKSIEEDYYSEMSIHEDMCKTLETQNVQLQAELKQAKSAAGKISRRYSIIKKENQIQCEEKERLTKKLDIVGTNMRKLEDDYKKQCESMKLRLQHLEEALKHTTVEKKVLEKATHLEETLKHTTVEKELLEIKLLQKATHLEKAVEQARSTN